MTRCETSARARAESRSNNNINSRQHRNSIAITNKENTAHNTKESKMKRSGRFLFSLLLFLALSFKYGVVYCVPIILRTDLWNFDVDYIDIYSTCFVYLLDIWVSFQYWPNALFLLHIFRLLPYIHRLLKRVCWVFWYWTNHVRTFRYSENLMHFFVMHNIQINLEC